MFSHISRQVKNLDYQGTSSKYHGSELWKPAIIISGAVCRYELVYCKKKSEVMWTGDYFKIVHWYWFGPKKICGDLKDIFKKINVKKLIVFLSENCCKTLTFFCQSLRPENTELNIEGPVCKTLRVPFPFHHMFKKKKAQSRQILLTEVDLSFFIQINHDVIIECWIWWSPFSETLVFNSWFSSI